MKSARIPLVSNVTLGASYRIRLRFDDGQEGEVDVAALIPFTGVFEPLKDHDYFRQVRVDRESGSIVWPNGADLDPLVLYELITGQPP
jgi:hypothetical protein